MTEDDDPDAEPEQCDACGREVAPAYLAYSPIQDGGLGQAFFSLD